MNVRERRQYWISKYKVQKGCESCGYDKHPRALCFDHHPDTDKHPLMKNTSHSSGGGMAHLYNKFVPLVELIEEIRKCRILCANCHMEHTFPMKYSTRWLDQKARLARKD